MVDRTALDAGDAALLAAIRAAAGLAAPESCQFEALQIQGEGDAVSFTYDFDFDGFSQYDRTVRLSGRARREGADGWLVQELAVQHVGEALRFALPPRYQG